MYDYKLSVYVATYNHENYIEQALDSIFMQKTQYNFEVLVGEDCSTDNTRNVLKRYEQKHPEYIASGQLKIFYRLHNMNKEIPSNADDLKQRCMGKYIIALEGDDYWTDCNKIERQIKFLENHPEYIAVSHNCTVVDENSCERNEEYPECRDSEYTFQHYFSEILPGQLTTLMYKNIYLDKRINKSLLDKGLSPGDKLIVLVLLCNGKIHCIQESMSAYRHITTHGDSFSANYKYNFKKEEEWYRAIMDYLNCYNSTLKKYGEMYYFRAVTRGIKSKQCTFNTGIKYIKDIHYKLFCVNKWISYKVRKDILHKKTWI